MDIMERAIWKSLCCFVSLVFLELCNGLPIGLDHAYADGHTQFLTGLIAVLLTVCGIVCLAGCMCCQRKDGFKEFQNTVVETVPSEGGVDHGHVNPLAAAGRNEFTIFNPLTNDSSAHTTQPPSIFAQQAIVVHRDDDWTYEDIDVRSWFGKGETEFPRSQLQYVRELGKGWFGRVVEGSALLAGAASAWRPVVVRILEASASTRQRILFLHDAAIYRCTPHPNILLLMGRSLDTVPLLLLQEYTQQGDVKRFLRQKQASAGVFLGSDLPLRWCYQLTSALKHLHSANIVHFDLATRNCRLSDALDLKLGDYGCSTIDYPEDYYHGTENVPIRWCAPESVTCTATTIQTKNVTQSSNIWSLGVCFWEIYECGAQPYADLSDDEVVSQVLGPPHVRLDKPKTNVLFTDYMYRLMQLCWSTSELRPTISQVYPLIEDLANVHKHSAAAAAAITHDSLPDFDARWQSCTPNLKITDHNLAHTPEFSDNSFDNLDDSWTNHGPLFDDAPRPCVDFLPAAAAFANDALFSSSVQERELQFKLGPLRTSSESETEDENWKRKVERGLYTEKVRQKSRSVADLMVLTHIDCSESDSETPLPSLGFRNVRLHPDVGHTFGSEGNLLSVQNTFEEELRKLQEDRRDSLLFVPDTHAPPTSVHTSPVKLLEELNGTSTIEPPNQIFNVYNVLTISPVRAVELEKIINYRDDLQTAALPDLVPSVKRDIPKLSEIIENNIELMDYIIAKYDPEDEYLQVEVIERVPECDVSAHAQLTKAESESDEYVTANTHTVTDTDDYTDTSSGPDPKLQRILIDTTLHEENENSYEEELSGKKDESLDDETEDFFTPMSQQSDSDEISDRTYCCDRATGGEITETVPNYIVQNGNHDIELDESLSMGQIESLNIINRTATQDFLNNEILVYEDSNLSPSLDERALDTFTSTPCPKRGPKRLQEDEKVSEGRKTDLKYSLETWDNFLGRSFDEQHEFADYSDEPMSLLFTEEEARNEQIEQSQINVEPHNNNVTFVTQTQASPVNLDTQLPLQAHADKDANLNATYELDSRTFIGDVDPDDIHLHMQDDGVDCYDNPGYWEAENSGWYLHPQDGGDEEQELQGEMDTTSSQDDSYIRFSMDDEVMAAIRNELMIKLPQAQKAAAEQSEEADGEYETTDRHEVFLRYNCFNMPLSPIPEESFSEYLNSGQSTPHCTINTDLGGSDSDSEWSEAGLGPASLEEDTHSPRLMESPHKGGTQNRHTPSQDSCCSNDTLFNLEELQCNERQLQDGGGQHEEQPGQQQQHRQQQQQQLSQVQSMRELVGEVVDRALMLGESSSSSLWMNNDCESVAAAAHTPSESEHVDSMPSSIDVTVIRVDSAGGGGETVAPLVVVEDCCCEDYLTANDNCFALQQHVAPLNSPEDRPWRHIEASLSQCPAVPPHADNALYDYVEIRAEPVTLKLQPQPESGYENAMNTKNALNCAQVDDIYDCVESPGKLYENENYIPPAYANGAVEIEDDHEAEEAAYANINHSFDGDEDYCPLGDIRFSGPGDVQMMTTSFSESNDLGDEHDWDSGSDTRSSSSGEFIWKEGEHEASVKALQAAPQAEAAKEVELLDDDETSSCSDEDADGIEFVPSAWDKFATPTKSAMRSPEKSLDRDLRKNRGVSFKKQKYHCVYEYPREPETAVVSNYDLWKDPSYIDWDLDRNSDPFLPGTSDYHETASASDLNLIHNQHISYDFTGSALDDDFYISSSAKPFDMLGAAASQFFPGKHCDWSELIKHNDNVTPDSGVEDITPGSMSDSSDYVRLHRQILPLKTLAQLAANKHVNVGGGGGSEIGGLRHTRNRLKLDLPPSPSAFSAAKTFALESPEARVLHARAAIPTFTTFGKSRFFVQQVDTSSDAKSNVSFEALPYKPLSKLIKNVENGHSDKSRIEVVRGEASLLDSADEDSGIESCTLERKNVAEVSE